jgi:phosphoglucosamine mutase
MGLEPCDHPLCERRPLAERELSGKGRIFVRYSGTEAKLRILVESESDSRNSEIAARLQSALVEDLGT